MTTQKMSLRKTRDKVFPNKKSTMEQVTYDSIKNESVILTVFIDWSHSYRKGDKSRRPFSPTES